MSNPTELVVRKGAKLKKLYTITTEVTFPDGEGGEETLYLKKINPIQDKEASEASQRVRGHTLALKRAAYDHPTKMRIRDDLELYGLGDREARISFVVSEDAVKLRRTVEARLAADPKWSENDYYIALSESWFGGMKERYDINPEDEEAAIVYDALLKFTEEVDAAYIRELDDLFEVKRILSDDELTEKCVEKILDYQARTAQMKEYDMWRIYFATYEDSDFKVRFFDSAEEVYEYPDIVERLITSYEDMALDALEGKG